MWALTEGTELRPRMPGLTFYFYYYSASAGTLTKISAPTTDHYESTDGAGGQFQGETNYGQIGRGAVGPSQVCHHGIIDVANHRKNVSDSAGGQFQARLNESVVSNYEVLPIRCV